MSGQIKDALRKAGYKPAEERLQEIAIKAMVKHADNLHDTIEEIRNAVSKDLGLMVHMFQYEKWNATRALLHRTRRNISGREGEGLLKTTIEKRAAIVVNHYNAEIERAIQQDRQDTRKEREKLDREYAEYLVRWTSSYIGKLEINGQPVWKCTPRTAKLHAESQGRRWKCVEMLCEGLPDDGHPIEYYRKPEEVAEIYKRTWKQKEPTS